jgi:GNAT superfamily N-acetyltransferase
MCNFVEVKDQKDIELVSELAYEIWNEHYPPIIGQAQVDYMLSELQSPQAIAKQIQDGALYLLIFKGQEALGYLGIELKRPPREVWLSKIYIRRDLRGQGFGRLALEQVQDLAKNWGAKRICLQVNKGNTASIQTYYRLGFVKSNQLRQDIGQGFVMDDYLLIKDLSCPLGKSCLAT